MKKIFVSLTLIFNLVACVQSTENAKKNSSDSSSPQPSSSSGNLKTISSSTPQDNTQIKENTPEFKPKFIKAIDVLNKLSKKDKNLHILDVRDKKSYDEGHIEGAINTSLPIVADAVKDIPKSAEIVTYCGCPHHLSSIGAEHLTNLGYKDVKVLDEGFWFWKDHKYPMTISDTVKSQISQLSFEGKLLKSNKPYSNVDIYLKHEKSGQLEAARTDKDGNYKIHFHIYDYKVKDNFKFYVENLKNEVENFASDKPDNKNIIIKMK